MILLYIIIVVFLFLAGYVVGCSCGGFLIEKSGLYESAEESDDTAEGTTQLPAEDINSAELDNAFTLLLGYNTDMAYGVKKT